MRNIIELKLCIIFLFLFLILSSFSSLLAKDLNISLILWRGETQAEKGFKNKLKEMNYKVNYKTFNAKQNRSKLIDYLRNSLDKKNNDYIYTFGTTVSKTVKQFLNNSIPQIFNIVVFPFKSNLARETKFKDKMIGVSNYISIKLQIKLLLNLFKIENLGVLYNRSEQNSLLAFENIKKICEQQKITIKGYPIVPDENYLKKTLDRFSRKDIDVLFLPADSFLVSKSNLISKELINLKIPSFASSIDTYINKGIMIGLVADYFELGKQAAELLHKHQRGIPLTSISIEYPKVVKIISNKDTIKSINYKLPNKFKNLIDKSLTNKELNTLILSKK